MESEEKLSANFKLFEYQVKEPGALKKCVEICKNFDIDADGITEKWLEFIQSTEDDKNLDVTVKRVEEFEEWCVINIEERTHKTEKPSITEVKKDDSKEKLDIDQSKSNILNASKSIVDDEDILEIYGYKKELSKNAFERQYKTVWQHWGSYESLPLPREPTKDLEKTEQAFPLPEFDGSHICNSSLVLNK